MAPVVVSVTRVDANHADWLFNLNVTVSSTTTVCKISGSAPGASVQQGPATIRSQYSSVSIGFAWDISAGEPALTPQPAFPQSGFVV